MPLKASGHQDPVLAAIISKGVNYLSASQVKQGDSLGFEGEWPSYIYNLDRIPFLGKRGKYAYDANVFNTLFIHNLLSEIYFEMGNDDGILSILQSARKSLVKYSSNGSFNFWPEMPKTCRHKNCGQKRSPVRFPYRYKFIKNYTNIYDDADDSSSGLLAYYYRDKIEPGKYEPAFVREDLYSKLVHHRDTGSRRTNWYNKRTGFKYRTGAYMTWFGPDRKRSGFFTWFFPYHTRQNILYGRNEVDCVVNANILRALYVSGDTVVRGISEAREFLRAAIQKESCFTCGVYYPTEFTFHYALAKAISSGVTGLDDLKEKIAAQIISGKSNNGYWVSQMEGNDLQATLYAANALMLLKGKDALPHIHGIMDYLQAYMIVEEDKIHWPGGVFFSGGTAIRYSHVWRSDAYTTCLALEAIVNYSKLNGGL